GGVRRDADAGAELRARLRLGPRSAAGAVLLRRRSVLGDVSLALLQGLRAAAVRGDVPPRRHRAARPAVRRPVRRTPRGGPVSRGTARLIALAASTTLLLGGCGLELQ